MPMPGSPISALLVDETLLRPGTELKSDLCLNAHAELYRLLGAAPQPDSGRDKPPCCDQGAGEPPILGEALAAILDRAAKLRKTRQARMTRPPQDDP